MRWSKWLCAFLFLLVALQGVVFAQSPDRPLTVVNRLRVEYDDNVRQQDEDKDSSLKIIEELEFHLDMNLEQTFISLRYRPSFTWWDDREEDDSDLHHDLDFILNHQFDPRLSLSIKDTFRLAELPELVEDNVIVREQNDFTYNTLNGTLSVILQPDTRLDVGGRHIMLRYDENDVSDREDYDLVVGGLTLRRQLVPETSVAGDLRYEELSYDGDIDRGSGSIQAGLNLEHAFSPNLLTSVRAGYQHKDFEDDAIDNESSPYVDGSFTVLPSPATRMTLGAGYSLFESGVFPYANQQRTRFFASLAHDVSAKISCYLSAVYTKSDYDAEQIPGEELERILATVDDTGAPLGTLAYEDGSEDVVQLSLRATYKLNRNNWLEAGWQYSQLESELSIREEFERNRIHFGWKIKL